MSFITAIGTATPSNQLKQSAIAEFMVKAMQLDEPSARRLRALFRLSGTETRFSVLNDYGKTEGFDFFPSSKDLEPFPSTRNRMELYRQHALPLSKRAVYDCLNNCRETSVNEITHLIVVSCTGMYAPGLDIDLVNELELRSNTERLCINFMGCYAAFNAIKQGDYICRSQADASVLIVCTELCSIHFQKNNTEDNILANALFADGSAALLMKSKPSSRINLKVKSFFADLATEGANDMAWKIGDFGFEMLLSSYVPDIINKGIHQLIQKLLDQTKIDRTEIDYFAIHPGGKKILEAIEKALKIQPVQNACAYHVLNQYGNMSSPTVLFVLKELFNSFGLADHSKKVLSVAFGPGLTLESMILEINFQENAH